MPFGLDTKSVIVGAIIGAVIVPRVYSAIASRSAK